jgi:hypothetical protein
LQSRAHRLWSRLGSLGQRLGDLAELAAARLVARRAELALAAALVALFVIAGGLSAKVALLGLAAALAFAALWPGDASLADAAQRASTQAGGDGQLWRLVVDAVPEPAVALNVAARISPP